MYDYRFAFYMARSKQGECMNDIIFVELENETEQTTQEIIEQDFNITDPVFMGMKIGGVALIISLGTAVIIHIFKRIGQT